MRKNSVELHYKSSHKLEPCQRQLWGEQLDQGSSLLFLMCSGYRATSHHTPAIPIFFFFFFLTLRCRLHTVKSLIFTHMEWMCASHLLTLLSLTGADPAGEETGTETTGYCFPVLQDWTLYTNRTVQRIHAVSWSPALSDRSKVCGQHHARLSFNLGSGQFCQILHCFFFFISLG